jgi:hypothetical protein
MDGSTNGWMEGRIDGMSGKHPPGNSHTRLLMNQREAVLSIASY